METKEINNVGNIGSRRRVISKSSYSAEDQALDQIAKEVSCSAVITIIMRAEESKIILSYSSIIILEIVSTLSSRLIKILSTFPSED